MSERPLWAPWRIEYITGPKDGDCIFCVAAASEADERPPASRPVDRAARCFTLLNAYPYAPGHVMVAPYRHVSELEDVEDLPRQLRAEISHFFAVYKDLDTDRHSEVRGWGDREEALETIEQARRRYLDRSGVISP